MNHFVPDFDTNDDYVNTTTNNLPTRRKPILGHEEEEEEDALMELLWQDGQVALQNQRHNTVNKRLPSSSVKFHGGGGESAPLDQNLFIQEDEMSSWLHFPLRHDDFSSDLLFSASAPPPQTPPFAAVTAEKQEMSPLQPSPRPIVTSSAKPPSPFSNSPMRLPEPSIKPLAPPIRSLSSSCKPPVPTERTPIRNFMNFSRLRRDFKGQNESGPSISKPIVRESNQVNPINTPSSPPPPPSVRESGINSRLTTVNSASSSALAEGSGAYSIGVSDKGKAVAVTSSTETEKKIEEDRKRKEREAAIDDEAQCRSEVSFLAHFSETKQGRVGSTKRSRAAQVHNLSERKRRDRINERMKSLQELIPRCNKSDKASMLDEAIEYMKSLQLQIQMMSMGCGMMPPPMMYPPPHGGAMKQQYIPHHHHHLAMGMGILGMDITTMNQYSPFMPFPNMLTPQIRPNLPTQAHHIAGFPLPNQQFDPTTGVQSQYPPPPPPPPNGYMDPYHQFRNLQPPQFQQNQATSYPSSSRVSSSKESGDQGNKPTG
ncbi:unnamed protein product [Cochlearia groenlandica]